MGHDEEKYEDCVHPQWLPEDTEIEGTEELEESSGRIVRILYPAVVIAAAILLIAVVLL